MPRLDQDLLRRLAKKRGSTLKSIRDYVSKRASKEGTSSEVAVINTARENGLGTASAIRRLDASLKPELGYARVWNPAVKAPVARSRQSSARARSRMPAAAGAKKRVFISHSSRDAAVVKELVELIRSAFSLSADQVVCTSLNGHRLTAGVITDEALQAAIASASAFIGVFTKLSIDSTYVLFECGARWGAKNRIVPLLVGGLGPSKLPGPLKNMNALNCGDAGQVHQLIGDLATLLKMEAERPEVFEGKLVALARTSRGLAPKARRIP